MEPTVEEAIAYRICQCHVVIVLGGNPGKLCLNVEQVIQECPLHRFDTNPCAIVFNLNVVGNNINHSFNLLGDGE